MLLKTSNLYLAANSLALQTLVFILYFILFSWLITRISFFKKSGLNRWLLVALFAIKIFGGLAYAWFYSLPAYHANSDTFRFFQYSLAETQMLLKNPWHFVQDLFSYGYNESGNMFVGDNSYWNDLKSNVVIKLLAVCNVFTGNNYYADIIFFNFLFFFGVIAFYRLMHLFFPAKKWLLLAGIFCLPSFLFWCSGIHKDGLIFSALGLIFWCFHRLLQDGFSVKRVIIILFCLALLFMLRNYVCLGLLPLLAAWYWSASPAVTYKTLPFVYVYGAGILLFFATAYVSSSVNFPDYIVKRQHEFMQLEGGSKVELQQLEPTINSFIHYFPKAIDMAFFRPHITEIKNISYIPAMGEVVLTVLLLLICIFYRNRQQKIAPAIIACWFFAASLLLLSGYTITFSGAIVRYRSLLLPFIIVPLLGMLRLGSKVSQKQNETH